jgi:hypothetical protein
MGGALGTGGAAATGGTTGTGGGPACNSVSPCGGNVVGTWKVSSSCLSLTGSMDVLLTSLGCSTVQVNGSMQTTGTFTANADGSYADNTTTKGSVAFSLAPSCLTISSVPVECEKAGSIFQGLGWTTTACTLSNGQCNCSLSVEQRGGLGFISSSATMKGSYTTSGSTLTTDDGLSYSYCASGEQLTVTPQMSSLKGTITLQKEGGNPGTGGASGTGGSASTGGGTATGGTATTGGNASGGGGTSGGTSSGGAASGGKGGGTTTGGTVGTGGSGGATGGTAGTGGSVGKGTAPCDIYAAANTTCVAAHSTIRALYSAYSGNLYQIKRASDGTTKDIPAMSPGGFAASSQQDTFCTGTTCTITKIYDQSGHGNFVEAETPDSSVGGYKGQTAANATGESLMVGGSKVYSLYTKASQAYWRDGSKSGMPLGSEPQGIYMVTSGKHFSSGCCYDYGNAEVSRTYVAGPTMDALYFGNSTTWGSGNGSGPWVMADLEGGIFSGPSTAKNNSLMSHTSTYVTAIHNNNGTTEMSLKAADATTGTLTTYYKGALPAGKNPMKKQGSIVLGSGGDCCYSNNNASYGTFYEGAIVAGYPSDATDAAIQANVVNAGYGK